MFNKKFWIEATERALKTFAQFVLALQAGDALNIFDLDWKQVISAAVAGVVFSYATSIVSAGINKKGTPSLVDEEG